MIFSRLNPHDLGRLGERRARWFYRLRGYRTVTNVRIAGGEIDLVARRFHTLVIAEVKTRSTKTAGEGFDAVNREKRERMIRLADAYAAKLNDPRLMIRYDVVSLYWTGWRFVLTHFADAFRPVADARRPWKWRSPT